MTRLSNIYLWLRRSCYFSGEQPLIQRRKRSSFDVDAVMANHEKRTEYASTAQTINTDFEVYRLVLPPPNVTGNLHLGHALTIIIEDAMCRYRRFQGQQVSWYPGFDHAGIATQVVVEKMLWKENELRRHQITQHQFLELCMKWKERRIADMTLQLKALGATLDWSKIYYTLDDRFCEAVTLAFCRLYSNGLIFNDFRMVNWCPMLRSTISDQEVDVVEVGQDETFVINTSNFSKRSIQVGVLHRIRYELLDEDSTLGIRYLEVGTTRPETVFADCALAVNPNDERYVKYVGRRVRHPLLVNRILPVLADTAVQANKGTGVLKIAPAHDFADFAIARKHAEHLSSDDLERRCIDELGCMINAPGFEGMDRFDARDKVIEKLIACDKYGGTMCYHEQQLKICSRTGDIIEPMIKKQWFMDCCSMNDEALKALKQGSLSITPKNMQIHLENWLNRKDFWCLSRQLDWGHRIPAFRLNANSGWVVARNKVEALDILGETSGGKLDLEQDNDVLDTWFCSALIPIVIRGWPRERINHIPLSVLETGYDIAGFWVARMITVCHSLTGYLPFPKIVLHGMVRDESGRKMSKLLGNGIDPMDVIKGNSIEKMLERLDEAALSEVEKNKAKNSLRHRFPKGIRQCGPDALRFALLRHDVTAMDINIDVVQTAEEGLRFCNKLWNLCIYAEELWDSCRGEVTVETKLLKNERIEDIWIMSRLESTLAAVDEKMNLNCPHLAFNSLHRFLWNDLCDVYVVVLNESIDVTFQETTKKALWLRDQSRLRVVADIFHEIIEKSLINLSIFMPFVSEYLFDRIKRERGRNMYDFCFDKGSSNRGKNISLINKQLENDMAFVLEVIRAIRSVRVHFHLPQKTPLQVACYSEICDLLKFQPMIQELCNVYLSTTILDRCNGHYLPYPVHGYSAEIQIILKDDYGPLVMSELVRRLQKAQKRKEKFLIQISKWENLIKSADKEDLVENHKRRISQARTVVNGMVDEILKLQRLIEGLK